MARVTVLGAGGWGIALALSALKNGNEVVLWSRNDSYFLELIETRGNEKLLPGIKIPSEITITSDFSCVYGSDITIIAVPSVAVREVSSLLSKESNFGIVVNVAKGIENDSMKRLSEIISDYIPENPVVVLSGPSHAEEVARNMPTSIVSASTDTAAAVRVQEIMSNDTLRVYTSSDVIGVELGGAVKNVIAIAAGFCDGLGLGDNTKAALITRGLAEMSRLGVAMNACEYTFAGLSGIGDLVVTCTSRHSRNNRFGRLVGSGTALNQALSEVGTVEGYYAAQSVHSLAERYGVEMPIVNECYSILYEGKNVKDVIRDLMMRPKREEH